MRSLVACTGSNANLARYLPPSVVSMAMRFAGIGPVETPPLSKRIMQGRSVTGLTSMITAAPLALTLARLTRCVTVSVPLTQLSLATMVGKDEPDPLAALARILAIRHHSAALIGPGMLGVIAHDAAEVKS